MGTAPTKFLFLSVGAIIGRPFYTFTLGRPMTAPTIIFTPRVNIPRHSRGLFINGHSPTLLATRESALVRLPLAKGSLLAASKLGFIS